MTVQELAADYRSRFTQSTREDGSKYWHVADGKQSDELQNLCHEAHGDMLPDDWRYSFIVEALDAIADEDDEDAARDSLEPDIYTSALTNWLGSHNSRLEYCDEAQADFGPAKVFELLQWGQQAERLEVFDTVLAELQKLETDANA